jgi:hypothetical protein
MALAIISGKTTPLLYSKDQVPKEGLPQIKSDDSIFGDEAAPTGRAKNDSMLGVSTVIQNKSKSTMPNTSRAMANHSISFMEANVTDVIAGNNNLSYLNTLLHRDAVQKIENAIQDGNRQRSRARRRRQLGARIEPTNEDDGIPFKRVGEMDARSSVPSDADTVANSSVYNMLADDMEGF